MKREFVKLGDPVGPYMEKFKDDIATMEKDLKAELARARITDILTKVDDLFLLRFRLSAVDVNEAKENCKACIAWRIENKEILAKTIRDNHPPHHHVMSRFNYVGWVGELADGHPLFVVRAGYNDTKGLMSSLSIDEVALSLVMNNELGFQKVDKRTREKNILVKTIGIIDLALFSFFNSRTDQRFFKSLGMSSHWSEQYYPQLQGKTVLVNCPSTIKLFSRIFAKFQNARSLEKQCLCPVTNSSAKSATDCPFLMKHKGVDQVCDFLGGTMPTPLCLQLVGDRGDLTETLTINAGKSKDVQYTVSKAKTRLYYEFLSLSKAVSFEIKLNDKIVLIPSQTLDSASGLHAAFVECPEKGTVKVTFSNPSGWSSREVQYMFHAIEDDEMEAYESLLETDLTTGPIDVDEQMKDTDTSTVATDEPMSEC
jgi:CRAL/TRIO domain